MDVTLVEDDGDYEEVTPENCYNSSDIGFNLLYTSQALNAQGKTNGAAAAAMAAPALLFVVAALTGAWTLL